MLDSRNWILNRSTKLKRMLPVIIWLDLRFNYYYHLFSNVYFYETNNFKQKIIRQNEIFYIDSNIKYTI